jgi:hypothetical protein
MLEELPVLNCPQLHTYIFAMNRISSLENLCRSKLPKIKIIHGYKNRLTGILPQPDFSLLSELLLQDNFIQNIDALGEKHLQYLQILRVSKNRVIGKLPILNMPNITSIQL